MYGFQPKHARGKPAQALAGGGLVHSITGMLGMRKRTPEEMLAADAKVQERNLEAAARVAARAKPTQQAAPAEGKAVSDYAGMSAMQRREKELGLKDGGSVGGFKPGGLIRGPGTGTSDSIKTEKRPGTFIMPADSTQAIGPEALERIGEPEEMGEEAEGMEGRSSAGDDDAVPVALSNGEFEFTPEQVQALGEAVLTVLRDATHTPVEGGKPTAKGFAPNQFFANGGNVKRLHLADAGVVTRKRLEEEGRVPSAAPAPQAPPATDAQLRGLYQDWQDKKVPWYMPTPRGNGEERAAEAAYTKALAGAYAGKALQHQPGAQPPASPAPTPPAQTTTQDAAASAATPATATLNSALEAQRRRDAIAGKNTDQGSAPPPPSDTPSPQAQAPQGREVVPGAYAHGRGQYSDNASGMGLTSVPGSGGQGSPVGKTVEQAQREGLVGERVGYNPAYDQRLNGSTGISAQNMAAADALAQRSQAEAMNRVARGFAPAGTASAAAPASGGENFDWMKDLRDPRTLALRNAGVGTTIFRNKGEEITANKARQARVAGVQQAINAQMHDAQQADTARYQSDNTLAGNIATEQMRQAGENQRSNRKLAIDAGNAAQEATARGFDIRAAQRREGILQRYDAAKTDQERVQLQRQYPDVFGREKNAQDNLSNNFMRRKVPVFDEQGRPTGTEREEIVDLRTGLALGGNPSGPPAPKSKAEFDALPKGARFTDPNGQVRIK